MQEINVYIYNGSICVDPKPPVIHSGDPVVWRFHNSLRAVKWCQIDFRHQMATLFKARSPSSPRSSRSSPGGTPSVSRGTAIDNGRGLILGTAPPLPPPAGVRNPPGRAASFKYTVRAMDKDGGKDVVEALDPEIIVEDP